MCTGIFKDAVKNISPGLGFTVLQVYSIFAISFQNINDNFILPLWGNTFGPIIRILYTYSTTRTYLCTGGVIAHIV